MPIYRCECKIVSRRVRDREGKPIPGRQRSVVGKAAYRAGVDLYDARQKHSYEYANRVAEVVHSEVMAPENAPAWLADREQLWNAIERRENRSDSQLAKEWLLSVPRELSEEKQIALVRGWCSEEIVDKGFVCDFAIHHGHGTNSHAHVLATTRPAENGEPEGFGKKPDMTDQFKGRGFAGEGAKAELVAMRESWAEAVNAALQEADIDGRVDHRSLADQGIDRQPEAKIGINALALQRKGIVDDPERVKMVRQSRLENYFAGMIRSVRETGEVSQSGNGENWMERAQMTWEWTREKAAWVGEKAVEMLRDESSGGRAWQEYVSQRREPDMSREPGMEPEL